MAQNLYNFFKEKGQSLPSVAERASLANQYGIQNYTGNAQQNAQLLQALQNQPLIGPVQSSPVPVAVKQNYMGTGLQSLLQSFVSPVQGNTVAVGGTPDVTQIPSEYNNGIPSYVSAPQEPIAPFNTPAPQFAPQPEASYKDNLNADIARITAEKEAIENELNGIGDERNTELTSTGVYDKLKLLDKLNGDLRQARNNESAIPLQARQDLGNTGPTTKADFASYTSSQLEKNALSALTASTQSGYITDQINTQLAITNQKFNEKKEAAKFKFEQTNKYLGTLQTTYADILTSEQATALESRKQGNAIELKNLDFNNDMLKTAYTEAIKNGANPADIQAAIDSGDLSKLYSLSGNTSVADAEIEKSKETVKNVQSMLDNTKGLSSSVGTSWLGRTTFSVLQTPFSGDAEKFRTDAKALVSSETLSYFAKVKASGANFGAMSESEWDILAKASDTKYLGIDRDTGKSNLTEEVFKERLKEYQAAAKKAVLIDSLSKAGKDPKMVKGLLPEIIDELYEQATTPQTQDHVQELSISSNIKKEESFSSTAYPDAGGYAVGYGFNTIDGRPVRPGDTITKEKADQMIKNVIQQHSTVLSMVPDNITNNQKTALVGFEYNLGSGIWKDPTAKQILASINSGDLNTAANLMQLFNKSYNPATGRKETNPALVKRRMNEANLLFA